MNRKIITIALISFVSSVSALAAALATPEQGTVIKEDVCGPGNIIIETTSGWYITAKWYGGYPLYEGYNVTGNLTSYGFKDVFSSSGNETKLYIKDYGSSLENAIEEHCDELEWEFYPERKME